MGSIFDGMTGLLSDTFGGPVTWLPPEQDPVVVQSIFRRVPVEVSAESGEPVLAMDPVWRVRHGALPRDPRRGDRIVPGDGETYRITAVQPSGSPAGDRFLVCELELVK